MFVFNMVSRTVEAVEIAFFRLEERFLAPRRSSAL
jgi:hypothetical protein